MKRIFTLMAFSLALMAGFSCAKRTVTRVNPDEQIDLSGRWNDTDSKLVASEMTSDVLNRPWIDEHRSSTGKKPVIIVGAITNRTHEHIEPENFVKDIEREFINTGAVRVVQDASFRERIREERADQNEFASQETAKAWGKELGADYIMFGTINSTVDEYNKKKVVNYKVNLELTNLETNEKVWIGDKEIKKYITN
ncbi:penicillin-binding protein activator LpoB [Roseivirga sp. BDSF3-8]|uniref:penicillin-binding protein activator LpoB n=1 Tax=Roseivirga sp. BDSF3-8 TaxID=3241598 RepID=UPI0035325C89